jgi:hypothetical protein
MSPQTAYFSLGLISCISLIEYRAFSSGLERLIPLGLDRAFSLGLDLRLFRRFEVQCVDIGLALAPPRNGEEAIAFERLEVFSDVRFVQPHVLGEPLLAGKAVVVLPRVAQEHGEREFVTGAEVFRLEEKIRDLSESATRGDIGTLEDYVPLSFYDVADGAHLPELHAVIIRGDWSAPPAYPLCTSSPLATSLSRSVDRPSSGVSIFCSPAIRWLVSRARSVRSLI